MKANLATFTLAAMCRTLGLSTSGYDDWLRRRPSERSRRDEETQGPDHGDLARERRDVRQPPDPRGAACRGRAGGPEARGAPDEGAGHRGRDAQALQDGHDEAGRPSPARAGTWCSGTFRPMAPTSCGWPTSRTCPPGRAGCTSRWCSTPGAGGSSAGPWRRRCRPGWSWTRSGWRFREGSRRARWSIIATRARSTRRWPSGSVAVRRALRSPMGSVGDAYDNAMCESFCDACVAGWGSPQTWDWAWLLAGVAFTQPLW